MPPFLKIIPLQALLISFPLFCSLLLRAQPSPLYIPREVQQTYQKGTRTTNGTPGPNYWQNHSDYRIRVELEPATRTIRGEETVQYTNDSPDTLRILVLRLYPNIFRKGASRDEAVSPEDVNDGVDITRLTVDEQAIDLKSARPGTVPVGTNMLIRLPSPLLPRGTLNLSVDWNYRLPKNTHIREGSYGENAFFVAYWYPQIAVYDDIDGWDRLTYTGTQEFYNDFSNFEVEVTVPKGFLVWATGEWQNPAEVLAPDYLGRYRQALQSDQVVRIVRAEDLRKGGITAKKALNTWKYRARGIPDFAFATSNRYLWDASSVVVDARSGRRTTVGAAYDPASKDFYEVARYGRQSVAYFSTTLPGIPFPYPNLTVFNGSGGMEFPMMVNDGSTSSAQETAEVTAHEIAHTYFPFYMGINERKYAWMDEGWAQFLPNEIPFRAAADEAQTFTVQGYSAQALESFAGKEQEMPMMIPSNLLTSEAYTYASYFRSGVAYALLQDLLGKDAFKRVLNEYMGRWHGKHPTPYDFFFSFNDATKEDLSWFWKPWFFERGYPDLAIGSVQPGKQTSIVVERKGTLPVPVSLKITFADGSEDTHYETARAWQKGNTTIMITKQYPKPIRKIELGTAQIPDVNRRDNVYEAKQ